MGPVSEKFPCIGRGIQNFDFDGNVQPGSGGVGAHSGGKVTLEVSILDIQRIMIIGTVSETG